MYSNSATYFRLTEFLYEKRSDDFQDDLKDHFQSISENIIYFGLRPFYLNESDQFQGLTITDKIYYKFEKYISRSYCKYEIQSVTNKVYLVVTAMNEKILLIKSSNGPVFIFDADSENDQYNNEISKLILLFLKKMIQYRGAINSSTSVLSMEAVSIEVKKKDNLALVQKIIRTDNINKLEITISEIKKIIRNIK